MRDVIHLRRKYIPWDKSQDLIMRSSLCQMTLMTSMLLCFSSCHKMVKMFLIKKNRTISEWSDPWRELAHEGHGALPQGFNLFPNRIRPIFIGFATCTSCRSTILFQKLRCRSLCSALLSSTPAGSILSSSSSSCQQDLSKWLPDIQMVIISGSEPISLIITWSQ